MAGALQQVVVDRGKRGFHRRPGLLRVQNIGVDNLEKRGIQFERLREHFTVRDHSGLEHLDSCQRIARSTGSRPPHNPDRRA